MSSAPCLRTFDPKFSSQVTGKALPRRDCRAVVPPVWVILEQYSPGNIASAAQRILYIEYFSAWNKEVLSRKKRQAVLLEKFIDRRFKENR